MAKMPILCAAAVMFVGGAIPLAAEPSPAKKRSDGDAPRQTRTPGKRATLKLRKTTPIAAPRSVVRDSLDWFARQQNPDGNWSFDGNFANPGKWKSKTGATAMALLPFLGAGQAHKQGKYKTTVDKGIQFLLKQMKNSCGGRDLRGEGGEMIWHGMATLVLCEAYAMTHDKSLEDPAKKAIRFIRARQDRTTGGWAPKKGEKPAMTVTVWQIMALKSGYICYLTKSYATAQKASAFLDAVRVDKGPRYGETSPKDATDTSTAAGLLCWMYVGSHDREEADEVIRKAGPHLIRADSAGSDVLYAYFATRVFFHGAFGEGGDLWLKWNGALRKRLTNAQLTGSDDAGSWFDPNDPRATGGGRLFQTSLNTMALESYHRNLPISRDFMLEEEQEKEEEEEEQESPDPTPAPEPPQGDPFGKDPFDAPPAPDGAPAGGGDPFGAPAAETPPAEQAPAKNDSGDDAPRQSRTPGDSYSLAIPIFVNGGDTP